MKFATLYSREKSNVRLNFIPVVHKSTAGSLFICDRCCQIFEVVLIFGCLA